MPPKPTPLPDLDAPSDRDVLVSAIESMKALLDLDVWQQLCRDARAQIEALRETMERQAADGGRPSAFSAGKSIGIRWLLDRPGVVIKELRAQMSELDALAQAKAPMDDSDPY